MILFKPYNIVLITILITNVFGVFINFLNLFFNLFRYVMIKKKSKNTYNSTKININVFLNFVL